MIEFNEAERRSKSTKKLRTLQLELFPIPYLKPKPVKTDENSKFLNEDKFSDRMLRNQIMLKLGLEIEESLIQEPVTMVEKLSNYNEQNNFFNSIQPENKLVLEEEEEKQVDEANTYPKEESLQIEDISMSIADDQQIF